MLKLGDLTRYISESVILGFMTGAGFLVALTQVGNLLGLEDRGTGHQHILVRLWLTVTSGGSINLRSVGVSLTTVVLVLGLRRLCAQVPPAAAGHAHGPDRGGGVGGHARLVASPTATASRR